MLRRVKVQSKLIKNTHAPNTHVLTIETAKQRVTQLLQTGCSSA